MLIPPAVAGCLVTSSIRSALYQTSRPSRSDARNSPPVFRNDVWSFASVLMCRASSCARRGLSSGHQRGFREGFPSLRPAELEEAPGVAAEHALAPLAVEALVHEREAAVRR